MIPSGRGGDRESDAVSRSVARGVRLAGRFPAPGREGRDLRSRSCRDLHQDILHVCLRIDAVLLAGQDERVEAASHLAAPRAREDEPVVATNDEVAEVTLCVVALVRESGLTMDGPTRPISGPHGDGDRSTELSHPVQDVASGAAHGDIDYIYVGFPPGVEQVEARLTATPRIYALRIVRGEREVIAKLEDDS